MLACLVACLDRPLTGNFKYARLNFNIMKIELMHLVGDREVLLPECSAGNLELRRLKLKRTWQLTACLLQIINGSSPTGGTNSITKVVKRLHASGR